METLKHRLFTKMWFFKFRPVSLFPSGNIRMNWNDMLVVYHSFIILNPETKTRSQITSRVA